jgi:hypothetical protein
MWPTFFMPGGIPLQGQTTTLYSNEMLYPWQESADPRHPDGTYEYRLYIGGTGTWKATLAEAIADAAAAEGVAMSDRIYCWSIGPNSNSYEQWPYEYNFDPTPIERTVVFLKINRYDAASEPITDYPAVATGYEAAAAPGAIFHTQGYMSSLGYWATWNAVQVKQSTNAIDTIPAGWDYPDSSGGTTDGRRIAHWWDENLECARLVSVPPGYTYDAQTYKVLQKYTTTLVGSSYIVTKYPLNPALPIGHADYSNETFWTAAYDAAVTAGDMAAGLTYGVHYPVTQAYGYYKVVPA